MTYLAFVSVNISVIPTAGVKLWQKVRSVKCSTKVYKDTVFVFSSSLKSYSFILELYSSKGVPLSCVFAILFISFHYFIYMQLFLLQSETNDAKVNLPTEAPTPTAEWYVVCVSVCVYAMPLLGSQGHRTVLETMGQDKRALLIILIKSISVLRSDLCSVCVTFRILPTGQKSLRWVKITSESMKK